MLKRFLKSESGATSIEYAIIASLVGAVLITAIGGLGEQNAINYDELQNKVGTAMEPAK